MIVNVYNSSDKSQTFSKIKEETGYKKFSYFPLTEEIVYVFEEKEIDYEDINFINKLKALTYIKEMFDSKNFLIFLENEGKIDIFIKENDSLTEETGLSLELGTLLVYYEKYMDNASFYYVPSENLTELSSSLEEIYQLENTFIPLNQEISEEDIPLISNKINLLSIIEKSPVLEKAKKYKKQIGIGFLILLLAGIGGYQYIKYQEQLQYEKEQKKLLERQKKALNFSYINLNLAKEQFLREMLANEDFDSLILKNKQFSTFLPNISEPNKYRKILKISDNLYYVEGFVKVKNKIKDIKYIVPINPFELFKKYNNNGFFEKKAFSISQTLSKRELFELISSFSYDNIWTYDITISATNNGKYEVFLLAYKKKRVKNATK